MHRVGRAVHALCVLRFTRDHSTLHMQHILVASSICLGHSGKTKLSTSAEPDLWLSNSQLGKLVGIR